MTLQRVCPLCDSPEGQEFARVGPRHYLRCPDCDLVWLRADLRPTEAEELAEYRLHRNDPGDPGYRRHLARLTEPLVARLKPGAQGLDFGCGPGPTISVMLAEQGFEVANHDPFFADDPGALARRYDFIACSETAEHFHRPAEDFTILAGLLRPGGLLGVMTRLLTPDIDFAAWPYIREISHVSFYSPQTLTAIAARHDWSLELMPPDLALFRAKLADGVGFEPTRGC